MILKILGILWVLEKLAMTLVGWLLRKRNKEMEAYRAKTD